MRTTGAIGAYVDSVEAEARSPRTIDSFHRDLAFLREHLGLESDGASACSPDLFAVAASPAVLELRVGDRPDDALSVNRTRSAVRGLFHCLVRAGGIPHRSALVLRVGPQRRLRLRSSRRPRSEPCTRRSPRTRAGRPTVPG